MTIDPFWAGVLATLFAEMVAFIATLVFAAFRRK